MPSAEEIRIQSENAYGQWKELWRKNAKQAAKEKMKSLEHFRNIGIGKAVICVATGYSFEKEWEILKEHQDKVDILCCDKSLGPLLDHGITPTYCFVCDAVVDAEKYLLPWKDQVKDIIFIGNVCGNPEWYQGIEWKDKYFTIQKDIIKSEVEFSGITGCQNIIPAGTNVSNALVVLLTQSDEKGSTNFFGYDKIILLGFDFSWTQQGNYYAFNNNGDGKKNYMKHIYLVNDLGEYCQTSTNLHFSCRWLVEYVNTFRLPVVQCSKGTILELPAMGSLRDQMDYSHKPEDRNKVTDMVKELNQVKEKQKQLTVDLNVIAKEHRESYLSAVSA